MANGNRQSLFGLGGLSQEEILARRAQERAQRGLQNLQNLSADMSPSGRMATLAGGQLGLAIGQKVNPAQLTPSQQQAIAVRDKANSRFTERLANARREGRELNSEQKSIEFQKAAAEAHREAGDVQQFVDLSKQAAQQERAVQKARLEQRKLETETQESETDLIMNQLDLAQQTAGDPMSAVIPDSDGNFDLQNPIQGQVQADGSLHVPHEDGTESRFNQWLPVNAATQIVDRMEGMADEGASTESRIDLLNKFWNSTERNEAREAVRAWEDQVGILNRTIAPMEELVAQDLDPSTALGAQGWLLRASENVTSAVKSVGKYASTLMDSEGNRVGSIRSPNTIMQDISTLRENDERLDQAIRDIEVPADLAGGPQASKYRSSVVQLAYAAWRSSEPGARQASNQDFNVALEQIGANAGNPRTMLATALDYTKRGMDGLQNRVNQAHNIGGHGALSERYIDRRLFGVNDFDKLFEQQKDLRERANNLVNSFKLQQVDTEAIPPRLSERTAQPEQGPIRTEQLSEDVTFEIY